jgi:hypothetical protein
LTSELLGLSRFQIDRGSVLLRDFVGIDAEPRGSFTIDRDRDLRLALIGFE